MFWVLWQHTERRRTIASLAAVTAVVLVAGAVGAGMLYHVLYDSTHRESATAALPVDQVVWVWSGGLHERQRLAEVIEDAEVEYLVMLGGDAHMVAIDDGSNSGYGPSGRGFPVLHAAALDRPGSVKGGPYSHGAVPGGGQFGALSVLDDGTGPVTVRLEGRDWTGRVLLSHTFRTG